MDNQAVEPVASAHSVARSPRKRSLKKQLLPNLIANGGIFALNILLGMWYTPYLIRYLGVAAYGLIPLANSLAPYLSLISLSLNGAAGRFLTIDLEREELDSANCTFNTVLFGNVGLIGLMLPVVIGVTWFVPRWFDVPAGQEVYAQWLFAATLGSYLLTLLQSSFSVSTWARNRFDLRNAVVAIHHLLRVGIVVVVFSLTRPLLWHVGLGIVVAALFGIAGDMWLWRRLTPQLQIRPSSFDRSRVRQLFGMGGWMVVNQVGTLLWRSDLIVANILLGAKVAGEYGSILLFSTMLSQLADTASAVLTPTILALSLIHISEPTRPY